MKKTGFTIIELLVTTTVMGLLFGIAVPNLFQARRTAGLSAETQYAINVYKMANAYFAENINATTLPSGADSCLNAYTIGGYSVSTAPASLTACSVSLSGNVASVTYGGLNSSTIIQ